MQLKKWGVLVVCVLTMMSFAGCTVKEEEPELPQIETEEPKEELSREIKKDEEKWRGYAADEVTELYPELKEVKADLFEKYPDVLVSEGAQTKGKDVKSPVEFVYWGGGGNIPYMGIMVNFKETVTKEQMIEACNYIIEQLRKLFPSEKQTTLGGEALIAYTSEGTPNKDLIAMSTGVEAKLPINSEKIQWKVAQAPDFKWTSVADPYEQPKAEEPPAEEQPATAVASELPLSKVTGVLSEVGFEITETIETTDGYVLSGKDAEGFSNYMITIDTNKNVQGMLCTISEIGQPLTGNDFLTKAMIYMGVCVKLPYEEEETGKKALRFITSNMDMGMLTLTTEEQTTTIGGWNISISYIEKSKMYMLYITKK